MKFDVIYIIFNIKLPEGQGATIRLLGVAPDLLKEILLAPHAIFLFK